MRPDRRRVVQLVFGVVLLPGQGHGDAQPFTSEELSESLPPPSNGSRSVSCRLSSCPHEGTTRSLPKKLCNLHEPCVDVVVSDACLDVRCVCPQRHGNAMAVTETNSHVPGHLGVKLPTTWHPPALDDTQL